MAQCNAQHPHGDFNKNNIIVLDRNHPSPTPLTAVAALTLSNPQKSKIEFSIHEEVVSKLREGYRNDPWCQKLISASCGMPNLTIKDSLWFLGERLIIPAGCGM
jgi:hypothetical protein